MPEDDLQWPHSFDEHRHVFIVRIWREPREIAGAGVEWRGVIEYLPTQERRYLNDLQAIVSFITPYLDSMGVQRGLPGQLGRWRNRWNRYWQARG